MKKSLLILVAAITIIIIVAIYSIDTNRQEIKIELGDMAQISYTATLIDGNIFEQKTMITIKVGENKIPGLDQAMIGLQSGSTYNIVISAADGYNIFYDSTLVQRIPVYAIQQAGMQAQQGNFIILGGIQYYIQKIENDIATIDSNPPHTRQDMTYNITIHSIEKQNKEG